MAKTPKKRPPRKKPETAAPKHEHSGRPPVYKPEFAEKARKLCAGGATDVDLAEEFGVVDRTIRNWRAAHSEFREACKLGKEVADDAVERSLYDRAVEKGDVTACIFWLKNRRPGKWRERSQHEHSGPDGGPIETKIEGGMSDREAARVIARFLLTAEKAADPPAEEKPETAPDADIDSGAEPS